MNIPGTSSIGMGVGIAAVAAVLLYIISRNAGAIGTAAGKAVGDAAGGVVLGIGDSIGIPRTNESACDKAIREGRRWDASFACPAGRFIGSLFGGGTEAESLPAAGDVNAASSSASSGAEEVMDSYYGSPFGFGA